MKKISRKDLQGSTQWYMLCQMMRLEHALAPLMLLSAGLGVVMPLCAVVYIEKIVDGLIAGENAGAIIAYAGIMTALSILAALLSRLTGGALHSHMIGFAAKLERQIIRLNTDVEYSKLDDSDFLKSSDRALRPMRNQGAVNGYINSMSSLLRAMMLMGSLGYIIATCSMTVIVVMLAAAIAIRMLQNRKVKVDLRCEDMLADIDRRYEYYDKLICDMSFGKEVRMYDMSGYIMGKIRADNDRTLGGVFGRLYAGYGQIDGTCSLIKHLEYVAVCAILVWSVVSGAASIGAYTARMAACISFSRALNLLIESYFEYKKQVGHLNGYREHCCFCDAHPCQAPAEHNNGNVLPIELDQVTFQYANTEKAALAGVSACFERGKSYAIVGENGAGKSTLIKLLTGYYTPSGGAITLGGNLAGHGLINTALPMFQQVNMYPASIRDNIQLDVTRSDDIYENSITAAGLENVLAAHGDHAMLIPEFSPEAIELSGGEAQRVALARTIFAGGAMLIMDEPTSAMDPRMEMRIYSQLIQQSGSDYDCKIIVSHRMACCRFVDVVLVMKDGRVIAQGTHDELLDTCPEYAAMWRTQARRYQL